MLIQKGFDYIVVIQDEINWILFLLMASGIFKISLKIRLIFIVWNTKKLAKHLLTRTFLGDSIYFRINLILAFYRIKHGKNWQNVQWHPFRFGIYFLITWNFFLLLYCMKHGKNWQNCTDHIFWRNRFKHLCNLL